MFNFLKNKKVGKAVSPAMGRRTFLSYYRIFLKIIATIFPLSEPNLFNVLVY